MDKLSDKFDQLMLSKAISRDILWFNFYITWVLFALYDDVKHTK